LRRIGRFVPLEHTIHIACRPPMWIQGISSVRNEAAAFDEVALCRKIGQQLLLPAGCAWSLWP
jgi:hypothetical protein